MKLVRGESREIPGGLPRGTSRAETPRKRESALRRSKKRRRLAAVVAFLLAIALAAAVLYGPFTRYLSSRRELGRAESLLAEETEATRALLERRERALSEEYVEGEARKMGYVKPGEIPLIVLDRLDPYADQTERDPSEASSP